MHKPESNLSSNPRCDHGILVYERCVRCEEELGTGKHRGFAKAEQPSSKTKVQWTFSPEMAEALGHLDGLVSFAYEQGYHEIGYSPVRKVADEIDRLQQDLARYRSSHDVLMLMIDTQKEKIKELEACNSSLMNDLLQGSIKLKEMERREMDAKCIRCGSGLFSTAQPPSDARWQSCADNPPKEWTVVLAYRPGPNTTYYLAERFLHSSGKYLWTMSGVTGHGVEPPSHWMPLPGAPVTKPERRWTCGKCLFLNEPTADRCSRCNESRVSAETHKRRVIGHASGWKEQMNTCICGQPWPCPAIEKSDCTCPPGRCANDAGAAPSDIRVCRRAGETNERLTNAEEASLSERGDLMHRPAEY